MADKPTLSQPGTGKLATAMRQDAKTGGEDQSYNMTVSNLISAKFRQGINVDDHTTTHRAPGDD